MIDRNNGSARRRVSLFRQLAAVVALAAIGWAGWSLYEGGYLTSSEQSEAASPRGGGPPGGPRARGGGPGGGFGRGASLVVTAEVGSVQADLDIRAVGTAEAARSVTLFSQVTGVVSEIAFTPGERVGEGDVLVRLVSDDQEVAAERARIAADSARAALERAERLASSNNITSVALADAQTALERAQVDLRAAELELAKRTIRAPFAGVLSLSDLAVGDLINSSREIATLDDLSDLAVAFDVPERASGRVSLGQDILASAEALPGERFRGVIGAVDSRVDPVSRSLKVRATLPNVGDSLRPGMAVTVRLSFAGETRLSVPSLAVQWDRDGPYVWSVADDTVSRTAIDIVARQSGSVLIVADIAAGDSVVVEGLQRLRDGAQVQVAGTQAAGGDAAPRRQGRPGAGEAGPRPEQLGRPEASRRPTAEQGRRRGEGQAGPPGERRRQGRPQGSTPPTNSGS